MDKKIVIQRHKQHSASILCFERNNKNNYDKTIDYNDYYNLSLLLLNINKVFVTCNIDINWISKNVFTIFLDDDFNKKIYFSTDHILKSIHFGKFFNQKLDGLSPHVKIIKIKSQYFNKKINNLPNECYHLTLLKNIKIVC